MRWPPVSLTSGTLYFTATSAIRRSSSGRADAARHLRDDGERAVLLDVGVHAVVDEPGVALVLVFARSRALQQRRRAPACCRRLPCRRPAPRTPPTPTSDRCSRIASISSGFGQRNAGHVVVDRRVLLDLAAARPLDHLGDQRSCTSRSPCRRASPPSPPWRCACPPATQAPIAPLVTPLQLQTCASAGISSSVTFLARRADVEQQRQPLLRQRACRGRTPASGRRPC